MHKGAALLPYTTPNEVIVFSRMLRESKYQSLTRSPEMSKKERKFDALVPKEQNLL